MKVSTKGQMVIPEAIRAKADIRAGDEIEVNFANGLVVLRKRRSPTPSRVRALLRAGRDLPAMTEANGVTVANAVQRVRRRVTTGRRLIPGPSGRTLQR